MPDSFLVYDQYILAAAALVGTFLGCGLLLWLMLRSKGKALTEPFAGVAPPFMNILGVLFALTLAFLGNDTWSAHDRAVRAVSTEADGLRGLAIIVRQMPPQAQDSVRQALESYAGAAVSEWSDLGRREVSARTSEAADHLLASLTGAAIASALPQPVANAAMGLATRIRESRDERIALSQTHVNPLKWLGMAFLGFLTMVSIAAVHIGAPRAMILAVGLFALAAAPTAVIVLIHGNPFQGPAAVSGAPIAAAQRAGW
jgi:hypothetical protein